MKINCKCGHLIHDNSNGLTHKAHLIPDLNWEQLFDGLDEILDNPTNGDAGTRMRMLFLKFSSCAWQCRNCGILFFENKNNQLQQFNPAEELKHMRLFEP